MICAADMRRGGIAAASKLHRVDAFCEPGVRGRRFWCARDFDWDFDCAQRMWGGGGVRPGLSSPAGWKASVIAVVLN